MKHVMQIALIGWLTAWSGFFLGSLAAIFIKKKSDKFLGSIMGFTAGLLVAFICFEMLPVPFAGWGLYKGVGALLLGVAVAAWLEGRLNGLGKWNKTGLLMILGVSMHNLPEGMALGSMLHVSFAAGAPLAVMIAIHCFPEAFAAAMPFRQSGMPAPKLLLCTFALALPMGLGALGGVLFSGMSPRFVDACVCFSGGVMLYITCGEIIPESKELWQGRMSAVSAMVGFVAGVLLTGAL